MQMQYAASRGYSDAVIMLYVAVSQRHVNLTHSSFKIHGTMVSSWKTQKYYSDNYYCTFTFHSFSMGLYFSELNGLTHCRTRLFFLYMLTLERVERLLKEPGA